MPKFSLIVPTRRYDAVETVRSIEANTTDYELILVRGQRGFAAKLNEGVALATGDYLIFLHDDCEVTPGWTDVLPKHVGSFCLGESNDSFDTWGGFVDPEGYCTDPSQHPDYSYWICVTKEAMERIGKFDPRFEYPYYQDVDTGLTIKKKGYKIECLPGKIIHHNGEGSGVPDERQRGYLNRKWGIEL